MLRHCANASLWVIRKISIPDQQHNLSTGTNFFTINTREEYVHQKVFLFWGSSSNCTVCGKLAFFWSALPLEFVLWIGCGSGGGNNSVFLLLSSAGCCYGCVCAAWSWSLSTNTKTQCKTMTLRGGRSRLANSCAKTLSRSFSCHTSSSHDASKISCSHRQSQESPVRNCFIWRNGVTMTHSVLQLLTNWPTKDCIQTTNIWMHTFWLGLSFGILPASAVTWLNTFRPNEVQTKNSIPNKRLGDSFTCTRHSKTSVNKQRIDEPVCDAGFPAGLMWSCCWPLCLLLLLQHLVHESLLLLGLQSTTRRHSPIGHISHSHTGDISAQIHALLFPPKYVLFAFHS